MDAWGSSESKASKIFTIKGSIDNITDEPGIYTLILLMVTETDANEYYSCTSRNKYEPGSCGIDSFPVLTLNIVQVQ